MAHPLSLFNELLQLYVDEKQRRICSTSLDRMGDLAALGREVDQRRSTFESVLDAHEILVAFRAKKEVAKSA